VQWAIEYCAALGRPSWEVIGLVSPLYEHVVTHIGRVLGSTTASARYHAKSPTKQSLATVYLRIR